MQDEMVGAWGARRMQGSACEVRYIGAKMLKGIISGITDDFCNQSLVAAKPKTRKCLPSKAPVISHRSNTGPDLLKLESHITKDRMKKEERESEKGGGEGDVHVCPF